jgi:hypothetical protein
MLYSLRLGWPIELGGKKKYHHHLVKLWRIEEAHSHGYQMTYYRSEELHMVQVVEFASKWIKPAECDLIISCH